MIKLLLKSQYQAKIFNQTSNQLVTFVNPVSYLTARKKIDIYSQFDFILPDGWLLVFFLRIFKIGNASRFSFDMTSIAPVVFHKATEQNQSIFFIGARPDEIESFISLIKANFPGINIIGYRDGYFSQLNERNEILNTLLRKSPDIVVAGLGAPLQEKFLVDLKNAGWNGCGYTCGGFIHQTSKKLKFYPEWVNNYHLRMPYRFIKEPHFRKRIPDYFKFIFAFSYDLIRYRLHGYRS